MAISRVQTIRLKPATKTVVLGNHDVDSVSLEFDPETGHLSDFRLELGRGFFIVWVLPHDRQGGRLRAILVDCAVVEIETRVEIDPCAFDFGPEEWSGELGKVGPDLEHVVEYVRVELTESPAFYQCRARIRNPDGTTTEGLVTSADR